MEVDCDGDGDGWIGRRYSKSVDEKLGVPCTIKQFQHRRCACACDAVIFISSLFAYLELGVVNKGMEWNGMEGVGSLIFDIVRSCGFVKLWGCEVVS